MPPLAIISDTHLRGRLGLPAVCLSRLGEVELILHAGDFNDAEVLRQLEAIGPVAAVRGNNDDAALQRILPEVAVVEIAGARIAMVHDAGSRVSRLQRLRSRFPDVDAVVFGHSHIPLLERDADGFQIFNPGSPTQRRRAPTHTMGLARVEEGRVAFELVDLG